MVELADILRRHWPAYVRRWGHRLSPEHHRAVRAILRCRTPQLGGQLYRCPGCGQAHYAYHSCGHRACPQCGHHDAGQWLARQQNRLLPVPYFLVTFTVPPALAALLRSSPKAGYAQLFAQSAATLQDVAATRLGIEPGFLGILQTWTRDLRFHPHVHYLVPGGGLTRKDAGARSPTPASSCPSGSWRRGSAPASSAGCSRPSPSGSCGCRAGSGGRTGSWMSWRWAGARRP